jgi:hypothetical protein
VPKKKDVTDTGWVACYMCRHAISYPTGECYAFRGNIPADIWDGTIMHITTYAGDNGLQFEQLPKTEVELMSIEREHIRARSEALGIDE